MKKYKPTSPGIRGTILPLFKKFLTISKPHKKLTKGGKRAVGRNNKGLITMRHKGAGHKRRHRDIDFKYDKHDMKAKIETVEYDPNRSAFISLICYEDGDRRYIISPKDLVVGDTFIVSENAPLKTGNRTQVSNMPIGMVVHNVELKNKGGARLARSAGSSLEIVGHSGSHVLLKMPSSEVRKVPLTVYATIGEVSNNNHRLKVLGKAGRSRWMGIRPTVRGSAMSPYAHPHGGGEGKAGRGRRKAVTKWGKPSGKGQRTRRVKKYSNTHIVRRRKVGKRR